MAEIERKVNDAPTVETEVTQEEKFELIPELVEKGYKEDDIVDIEKYQEEYLRAEENYDKYLRAVAECQNVKKRITDKKNIAIKYKNENILKDMLSVIDNFDRAFNTYKDAHDTLTDKGREILDGMELIYKSFKEALTNAGLKEIEINIGDDFTTDTMNAIMMVDNSEYEVNKVVNVVSKGYMYNDKVIRYAAVVVCNRN